MSSLYSYAQEPTNRELIGLLISQEKISAHGHVDLTTYQYACDIIFREKDKTELGGKGDSGLCFLNEEEIFLFNLTTFYEVEWVKRTRQRIKMSIVLVTGGRSTWKRVYRFKKSGETWYLK